MLAKAEDFLHQIVEPSESSNTKSHMLEVAMIVNAVASSLRPAIHDTVDKAINARMSGRNESAKHFAVAVTMDVLLSDPTPNYFQVMQ